MKTTIDLPENLLHRAKVVAAQRRITLKELFVKGLDLVLKSNEKEPIHQAALTRLKQGLHLGGKPLSRNQIHERHPVS